MLIATFLAVPASATFDSAALNQQVQEHQATLDNLKPRVDNNEKDIKALQDNTNTSPAADRAVVPADHTPPKVDAPVAAAAAPAVVTPPTTKTIVAVSGEADPSYAGIAPAVTCKYEYDNGSVVYERSMDPKHQCKAVGTVEPL